MRGLLVLMFIGCAAPRRELAQGTEPGDPARTSEPEPAREPGTDVRQSDILEVVIAQRHELARCSAEQRRREPRAEGRVVMQWRVDPSGEVSDIAELTPAGPAEFVACLTGVISGLRFPAHEQQSEPVEFPFEY